jgi:hypothetical protein
VGRGGYARRRSKQSGTVSERGAQYGELAKQAEPDYLAAVFRKVAMQYGVLAEDVCGMPSAAEALA